MKNLKVTVNGTTYDVQVEEIDNEEQKLASSTTSQDNSSNNIQKLESQNTKSIEGTEEVKSPMPGTIVSINVNENQKVTAGDILFVLEAMKMENEIASPKDGTIVGINASKGQSVEAGQTIILLK